MPHLIVEYSNNLPEEQLAVPTLLETLCRTAVATGLFPETGLRARAYRADHQRVGAGDLQNAFVHVSMIVGKGRGAEARQSAGSALFDVFKSHLAPVIANHPVLLSFEMRELDDVKFNYKTQCADHA
ncbi:MAG: 5-carboxymethyl-2-hydroxymuconate isomerase [Pseudomonadales bacterium]